MTTSDIELIRQGLAHNSTGGQRCVAMSALAKVEALLTPATDLELETAIAWFDADVWLLSLGEDEEMRASIKRRADIVIDTARRYSTLAAQVEGLRMARPDRPKYGTGLKGEEREKQYIERSIYEYKLAHGTSYNAALDDVLKLIGGK